MRDSWRNATTPLLIVMNFDLSPSEIWHGMMCDGNGTVRGETTHNAKAWVACKKDSNSKKRSMAYVLDIVGHTRHIRVQFGTAKRGEKPSIET